MDLGVDNDSTGSGDDDGVEVHFGHLGDIVGQAGNPEDHLFEAGDVDCCAAPITEQEG